MAEIRAIDANELRKKAREMDMCQAVTVWDIDDAPTISPDIRPKGRWVVKPLDGIEDLLLPHCSECDTPHARERNFCNECGADMTGDDEHE